VVKIRLKNISRNTHDFPTVKTDSHPIHETSGAFYDHDSRDESDDWGYGASVFITEQGPKFTQLAAATKFSLARNWFNEIEAWFEAHGVASQKRVLTSVQGQN
jgi:hypothetical protein